MKKVVYFLFTCFLILSTSCNEDENPSLTCGVQNPTEDLAWMKELIVELESTEIGRDYSYIKSVNYGGNTYYYVGSCCPICFWNTTIYNCQGEVQEDLEITMDEMSDVNLVWKAESNACNFEE